MHSSVPHCVNLLLELSTLSLEGSTQIGSTAGDGLFVASIRRSQALSALLICGHMET